MIACGTNQYYQQSLEQNINPHLKKINPDLHIYCVCLKVPDYIETQTNKKERTFWLFDKVLCIISYYPLQKLFVDLLYQVIDNIRLKKYVNLWLNGNI